MTQNDRVLAALIARQDRGITPVDFAAPDVIDNGKPIMRVAARIHDLRQDGIPILEAREPNGTARYTLHPDRAGGHRTPAPAPPAETRQGAAPPPPASPPSGAGEPSLFNAAAFERPAWMDAA